MLEWSETDGLATMWLNHGPVNALDREFLVDIATTVRAIEAEDVGALIVTGRGSCFSAGADLYRVLEGGASYIGDSVQALSDTFEALFTFKRPMVAAINGHAIAGGCIIAAAADHRVMAEGDAKIGISELRVGVPFPTYALEIMRYAAAPHRLQELVLFGRSYGVDRAIELGLADEVVTADSLIETATVRARRLAAIPRGSFETMKRALRTPTIDRIAKTAPTIDGDVKSLWQSDDVTKSIERFLETTLGSSKR